MATDLAIFWWWMGKSMGHKWSGLYPKASNLFWQSVKRKHSNNTTESMSRRHEQVRNVSSLWTGLVPRLPTLEVMVWIKRLRCFKATVPYLYHLDSRFRDCSRIAKMFHRTATSWASNHPNGFAVFRNYTHLPQSPQISLISFQDLPGRSLSLGQRTQSIPGTRRANLFAPSNASLALLGAEEVPQCRVLIDPDPSHVLV